MERMMVAVAAGGDAVVIYASGETVEEFVQEFGCTSDALDIPAREMLPGVTVWEGDPPELAGEGDGVHVVWRGKFRDPTAEEWAALMRRRAPWAP